MAKEKTAETKKEKEEKKEATTTMMNNVQVIRSTSEIGGPGHMLHRLLRV